MLKSHKSKILFWFSTILAIVVLFLWLSGRLLFWTKGIEYVADVPSGFINHKGHVISGESTVSIDLSNLERNIGKEVYNDGQHKIYVSWIRNTGDINKGGYEIFFRSSGKYSFSKATLISGIQHTINSETSLIDSMSAKMMATYKGKTYHCEDAVFSSLNFRDGDEFSFYIFPIESYESKEVTLNEKGIVYLTMTNLYKNSWSKK
ncbi:hypothetical protein ACWV26_06980 [Rummeliibacillus sp. JY-2-4R]